MNSKINEQSMTSLPGQAPGHIAQEPVLSSDFAQGMNTLYVQTRILANNVVSLFLHLATDRQNDTTSLLSRFQVSLFSQLDALQQELQILGIEPASEDSWARFAAIWRISDVNNKSASIQNLIEATNELSAQYEALIPEAMRRTDSDVAFYMLANHQSSLSRFLIQLERLPR